MPHARSPPHAHEITPADAALLQALGGATFGPNASITLPSGRTVAGSEIQQWTEKRETVMNEDRFLYAERIGVSRTPKVTPPAPTLTKSVAAPYNCRSDPTATFRFGVCLGVSPLILIVIIALLVL